MVARLIPGIWEERAGWDSSDVKSCTGDVCFLQNRAEEIGQSIEVVVDNSRRAGFARSRDEGGKDGREGYRHMRALVGGDVIALYDTTQYSVM